MWHIGRPIIKWLLVACHYSYKNSWLHLVVFLAFACFFLTIFFFFKFHNMYLNSSCDVFQLNGFKQRLLALGICTDIEGRYRTPIIGGIRVLVDHTRGNRRKRNAPMAVLHAMQLLMHVLCSGRSRCRWHTHLYYNHQIGRPVYIVN